jgi:hypothetical protein
MTPPLRWTQTKWAESSSTGSLLGSWVLELCLGREKAGASKVFEKIVFYGINRNFIALQKFISLLFVGLFTKKLTEVVRWQTD